jgi:hypothetical protein
MVIVPFKLIMEKFTNLSLNYNVKTTIELPTNGFPTTNMMNFTEIPQESSSRLDQIATLNFASKDLIQAPSERIKVIVHQNRD